MKTAMIGAILVAALMFSAANAAANCSCEDPPRCACEASCDCGKDCVAPGVPKDCCPREELTLCCEREEFRLLCKPCEPEKPAKCKCREQTCDKCNPHHGHDADDWGFE
jgi:hypothetical protein